MLLLDARLLGAGRSFPLTAVSRTLTPLAVAGLLLLLGLRPPIPPALHQG